MSTILRDAFVAVIAPLPIISIVKAMEYAVMLQLITGGNLNYREEMGV